jgi:hypothetical protein
MNAARPLAAILAVDVVGYSRLMGEDEAGTTLVHREAAGPITVNATDRFPPIPVIQIAANRAPQTITPNSSRMTDQTTTSSCEVS